MKRSFWSTIRGKLLARTLVVVLVPVLVIAGVAIASLRSLSNTADDSLTDARSTLSEEVVGSRVASVADQIARELAIFLDERVADTELWATDVGLTTAAKGAAGRAAAMGLQDQTIEQIEARFQDDPRLNDVHVERDLLKFVASTPAFKEIFLTDVNGYNVDYSNRTSDFVQSDEGWWERAMTTGLDISEPGFDASAEVFAVNIAIRLEDEGTPVGVLKAALDMNVVQIITDRFADGIDGYDISIVDNAGRFLAETSSGHSDDHIMNLDFLASDSAVSTPLVREVFAPNASELHADGFSLSDDGVAGFAHVDQALSSLRSERGTPLNGFGWTVIVEQPAAIAFSALTPLEGLAGEVSSTSSRLTALLVLVALAGSLAAAYMALVFARKITSPIAQLRDAANKAAEITLPNVVAQIDALQPGEELPELEFLSLDTGDEVEDLAQSFNTVQQTAADLASEQARMRRTNVSTTFVNLGRRNQNLLSRQLEHINSMEGNETNPETLQRLFQLDHLVTRMRRNAESLLVLAGEDTPRRFRKPVSMHQLLQAAGGETEDFSRIELTSLDEARRRWRSLQCRTLAGRTTRKCFIVLTPGFPNPGARPSPGEQLSTCHRRPRHRHGGSRSRGSQCSPRRSCCIRPCAVGLLGPLCRRPSGKAPRYSGAARRLAVRWAHRPVDAPRQDPGFDRSNSTNSTKGTSSCTRHCAGHGHRCTAYRLGRSQDCRA